MTNTPGHAIVHGRPFLPRVLNLLLVGAGGFAGSVLRYLVQLAALALPARGVPLATLAVNVAGSFAIGLLLGSDRPWLDERTRLLVVTGVLGGFTTWSAFAWETVSLARGRAPSLALANVALHLLLGLAAAWAGVRVAAR